MVRVLIDVHEDFNYYTHRSYGAVWDRVMFIHTIFDDVCFVLEFYPDSEGYRQCFVREDLI